MTTRILAILLIAAAPSMALAQSATGTSFTTKPMQTAPASSSAQSDAAKNIPPAARSGEKGLRVGNDAVNGQAVEIKRNK